MLRNNYFRKYVLLFLTAYFILWVVAQSVNPV